MLIKYKVLDYRRWPNGDWSPNPSALSLQNYYASKKPIIGDIVDLNYWTVKIVSIEQKSKPGMSFSASGWS